MAEVTTPIITDTTGQSIASAISGLGTALGSDKANIDGSNIANPSAFRTAINAINLVVLKTNMEVTYADNNTLGYRSTNQTKVDPSTLTGYPTGHTVVGIIAQNNNQGYISVVWVDEEGYIRASTKVSASSLPVAIYCFYI